MCSPTAPTMIDESFVPLYLVFGIPILPSTFTKEVSDGLITLFTGGWKVIFDSFYNFRTDIFVHPFRSLVIGHMERPTGSRYLFAIRIATTISFVLTMDGQKKRTRILPVCHTYQWMTEREVMPRTA
jgi:hypothetical protein